MFRSIWILVTMLCLLGNMVLIDKKHPAAYPGWKVLWLVLVVTIAGEIPLTLAGKWYSVIAAEQALRATGNEVAYPLP